MSLDRARKLIQKGQRLLGQGEHGTALKAFRKAVQYNSQSIEGWSQLGNLYMRMGYFAEAADCYRHITDMDQENLIAHGNLGICYYRLQQLDSAISSYGKVLELQPGNVAALCNFAMALLDKGEREQAATLCDQAIRLQPEFTGAYMLRGQIHASLGEFELSAARFHKAAEMEPGLTAAIAGEANALIKLGDLEHAYSIISPHIQASIDDVSLAIAYASLHELHGNSEKAARYLESLLAVPSLTYQNQLQLHFSAGELYDQMKMFDKAFSHYKMGNSCVARNYSAKSDQSRLGKTMTAFNADTFKQLACKGLSTFSPVFIVGMPRSGTSLVEKILSRHSQVCAGGEMPYISQISDSLLDRSGSKLDYPENILEVDVECMLQQAKSYKKHLDQIANDCSIVTDKMPHNYLYLGLIQLLFPGARIIHCRRNVLDTCLSNYFQYYSGRLDFAYRLEDIADHYNNYSHMMAHWRQVLDIDMFEVNYEDLVSRQEETTHELVNFCDLQWESSCLTFYESSEITRTASFAQVRQPLYRHAVERWRYYEKHLQPLIRRLDPLLLDTK